MKKQDEMKLDLFVTESILGSFPKYFEEGIC